ncbi:MAG: TraB/GumN family protein, partial [Sandarakinorhabdus sp.]|nr:TraB/GumN family protein [Sandarakinorhabdus sp.]
MIRLLAFLALVFASPALAAPGMWVVRDADTEITLFGTVHALAKDDPWFGPAIKARLDAADTLVLETIIPADKAALASIVMAMGTRAVPKPLEARVSKKAAPQLALAAQRTGLALPVFDRMDTWLAATILGEASLAQIGIEAASGVEPALDARARAAGKPVIGLESIEQQLGYFDAMPEVDQVAMLEATLDDLGTAKADSDR